jgi:hypothetical protein
MKTIQIPAELLVFDPDNYLENKRVLTKREIFWGIHNVQTLSNDDLRRAYTYCMEKRKYYAGAVLASIIYHRHTGNADFRQMDDRIAMFEEKPDCMEMKILYV